MRLCSNIFYRGASFIFWSHYYFFKKTNSCQLLLIDMCYLFLTGRTKRQWKSRLCVIGSVCSFDCLLTPAFSLKSRQPIGRRYILQLSSTANHIPLVRISVNQTNASLWLATIVIARWLTCNWIGQRLRVGRFLVWALQGFTESECRHERWVGIITLVFILLCYFFKPFLQRLKRIVFYVISCACVFYKSSVPLPFYQRHFRNRASFPQRRVYLAS